MPIAELDGRRLLYERRGAGKPLLLVQGLSANLFHWHPGFLEPLTEGRELILYEHRGVGAGERLEEPFTVRDLAEDAVALLGEIGIDRADVLGCSLGGMVAQEIAHGYPDRVDRLVLGCTRPGGEAVVKLSSEDREEWQRLAEAMNAGDEGEIERRFWRLNFSEPFWERTDLQEQLREATSKRRIAVKLILLQLGATFGHRLDGELRDLSQPTLVVHGTADRVIPAENSRLLADRIPESRLEWLEGAGHLFWWERPEETGSLAADFLNAR